MDNKSKKLKRQFKEEEILDIIESYKNFKSKKEISKKYKSSNQTISKILRNHNIKIRNISESRIEKISKSQEIETIKLYNEGKSIPNISKEIKINRKSINRILKENKIKIRNIGEQNLNKYLIHDFFKDFNIKSSYWIGFIAGDGSILEKQNTMTISINENDKKHLEKLKQDLNSNLELRYYQRKDNSRIARLNLHSKEIINDLIKIGITPRKTFSIEILKPELLKSKDFWRGVIDANGCIRNETRKNSSYSYPTISLMSASWNFINQYKTFIDLYLQQEKNINNIQIKKNKNYNNSYYVFYLNSKKAYFIIKYLYSNSEIFLDRKQEKAEEIILQFKDRYEK